MKKLLIILSIIVIGILTYFNISYNKVVNQTYNGYTIIQPVNLSEVKFDKYQPSTYSQPVVDNSGSDMGVPNQVTFGNISTSSYNSGTHTQSYSPSSNTNGGSTSSYNSGGSTSSYNSSIHSSSNNINSGTYSPSYSLSLNNTNSGTYSPSNNTSVDADNTVTQIDRSTESLSTDNTTDNTTNTLQKCHSDNPYGPYRSCKWYTETAYWKGPHYHNSYIEPETCNPYWHVSGRCCEAGCSLCYCRPWKPDCPGVPVGDLPIILLSILVITYIYFKHKK